MLISVVNSGERFQIGEVWMKLEVRYDGKIIVTIDADKSIKITHGAEVEEWREEKEG